MRIIFTCTCTCMSVCTTCIRAYVHTCIHKCLNTHRTHTPTHTHIYTHIPTLRCTPTPTHTHTHTHTRHLWRWLSGVDRCVPFPFEGVHSFVHCKCIAHALQSRLQMHQRHQTTAPYLRIQPPTHTYVNPYHPNIPFS